MFFMSRKDNIVFFADHFPHSTQQGLPRVKLVQYRQNVFIFSLNFESNEKSEGRERVRRREGRRRDGGGKPQQRAEGKELPAAWTPISPAPEGLTPANREKT